MGEYQISPDQPPFPMPMNLPFQPEAGIQTSNLMSESGVGLTSTATRQNAGRLVNGGPGILVGLGGVNVPAGSTLARVMVVSGSARVARLSHVAESAEGVVRTEAAEKTINDANKACKGMARGVPDEQVFINASPNGGVYQRSANEKTRKARCAIGVTFPPLIAGGFAGAAFVVAREIIAMVFLVPELKGK